MRSENLQNTYFRNCMFKDYDKIALMFVNLKRKQVIDDMLIKDLLSISISYLAVI